MSFDAQCGERLREERDRLGQSQQALADQIGVQRALLSRYERGLVEPGAGVLMKLAAAGIDVTYVLWSARSAKAEDWRLLPSLATAQSVLDRLAEMAKSHALEVDDWQLIDQLIRRLSRS